MSANRALRRWIGSITRVVTDQPAIALTFDDGPDPETTPLVLQLLERYQAKATFFMVGETAQDHPDVVRMVSEAGHTIGNHSWDHKRMPLLPRQQRVTSILKAQATLRPYVHNLFRPPHGEQNRASRVDAWLLGYEVVGWSVHGNDWSERNPQTIYETLMSNLSAGSIVLLHDRLHEKSLGCSVDTHDLVIDRAPMLNALSLFLERIQGQYALLTVPELVGTGRPHRAYWFHQTTAR